MDPDGTIRIPAAAKQPRSHLYAAQATAPTAHPAATAAATAATAATPDDAAGFKQVRGHLHATAATATTSAVFPAATPAPSPTAAQEAKQPQGQLHATAAPTAAPTAPPTNFVPIHSEAINSAIASPGEAPSVGHAGDPSGEALDSGAGAHTALHSATSGAATAHLACCPAGAEAGGAMLPNSGACSQVVEGKASLIAAPDAGSSPGSGALPGTCQPISCGDSPVASPTVSSVTAPHASTTAAAVQQQQQQQPGGTRPTHAPHTPGPGPRTLCPGPHALGLPLRPVALELLSATAARHRTRAVHCGFEVG